MSVSTSPGATTATAERLLEAAAAAFADRGFQGTSTRDIALRAGLSPAGVYVHFASKEALLHELSRRGHESAVALVETAVAPPGTPAERVARLMSRFAAWHAEHHEVARVVQYELPHLDADHLAQLLVLRRRIDAAVRALVGEGVEAGVFVAPDVRDSALALLSLCVDVARWYAPSAARSPAQIGAAYAELGLRLLAAPIGAGHDD